MNKTKAIFLFLLLLLPVLIYMFLQGFGKNQFAIPVYFERGLTGQHDGCLQTNPETPYTLDDQLIDTLLGNSYQNNVIVYEIGNQNSGPLKNNLYTFLEKYKDKSFVKLVSLRSENDTSVSFSSYQSWLRYNLPDSNLLTFGRCILQLKMNSHLMADSGLVLVDQKRRIRGYYDPLKLKEIDRLNTELYILLTEKVAQ